jgi:hypothetical protein
VVLKDAAANHDVNGEGPHDNEPIKLKVSSFFGCESHTTLVHRNTKGAEIANHGQSNTTAI